MKHWMFDGQLSWGEIGEPVELVAQIVQDWVKVLIYSMVGEFIDGVPRRKLNLFVLCDIMFMNAAVAERSRELSTLYY